MIAIDDNPSAFVAHFKDLPIPERMLLSIEKQVALLGRDGARIAGILENAGTRNGAAVQHYYGDKDTLIYAAFIYRYKAYNDWCRHYLELLEHHDSATPNLNYRVLGLTGAWAYLCKHSLPYCYHAGFIQKMGLTNPGTSGIASDYTWNGPTRILLDSALAALEAVLGNELYTKRIGLGALHLVNVWAAKERSIREALSSPGAERQTIRHQLDHFSVEMTETLCANLLREKFRPFESSPLELLHQTDARCGEPVWHIEKVNQ
ncbi:AcrR family transcriptional regulator [Litorivivens lipolytica]|uniref:AcrR family transcriptional regulator n=1 Tax=Litorivivens lipolytica TaxID=1524264 RepID=A0A7W4W723_9GAMM|nr:hypothetical protein [Litorivivens lipolytica]MBB3048595.1 AcrR family transcriptional regulator [Litorivivens lipolytica]